MVLRKAYANVCVSQLDFMFFCIVLPVNHIIIIIYIYMFHWPYPIVVQGKAVVPIIKYNLLFYFLHSIPKVRLSIVYLSFCKLQLYVIISFFIESNNICHKQWLCEINILRVTYVDHYKVNTSIRLSLLYEKLNRSTKTSWQNYSTT